MFEPLRRDPVSPLETGNVKQPSPASRRRCVSAGPKRTNLDDSPFFPLLK